MPAEDERYAALCRVECARCGAAVLAAKFSPQHTSVQWSVAAVRACWEFSAAGRPSALHFEMQLPPAAVARSLRLPPGQPAAMVAVRFEDPETAQPVALTFAAIRPDLFRIVVESGESPLPGSGQDGLPGAWTHAVKDWETPPPEDPAKPRTGP